MRLIKAFILTLGIFFCIIALILVRCVFVFLPHLGRKMIPHVVYIFGKLLVFVLGIKVILTGRGELLKSKGVLFVSNHLSYLDGIIATSLAPIVFIARADLRKWPLFGLFSFLSNTIFVERIRRAYVQEDADKIYKALKDDINVILYPEGTSADGRSLLPFKSSFFMAPILAQAKIVPLAIKYKKINSDDINEKNKDLLYWYGEMEFIPHIFKFLTLRKITVEVKVCEPIMPVIAEGDNLSIQRKILADACRKAIEAAL
ncbi:MAG: lysophospholipid acyltransferase family protein [Candidatus Omnitrophica bacterium]|nr:lysophospholipid acyltransferase family protein [Candidatus Omnitrophota bacterium]